MSRYHLSKETIIADLGEERPQWPFSAYGPGRDAPRQLLEGFPLEQSMEEMRLMYYLAQASGNPQQGVSPSMYAHCIVSQLTHFVDSIGAGTLTEDRTASPTSTERRRRCHQVHR